MHTRQLWIGSLAALVFGACTQSYDDFDFSGATTATGGTGATGGSGGSGAVGGSGGSGAVGGSGGSGAVGGTGGTGASGGTGGTGATGGTGGSGAVGGTGGTGATGGTGGTGATGGTGGSGGSLPTCEEQYTHGNIHELCTETAAECTFRIRTNNGQSCDDVCMDGGGECVGYYNDEPNGTCNLGAQMACDDTGMMSAICICSHGCGSGMPCTPPDTCQGGTCQ